MAAINSLGVVLSGSTGTDSFVGSTSPVITTPTINTRMSLPLTPGDTPTPAIQIGSSSLNYSGILYGMSTTHGNLAEGQATGVNLNMGVSGTNSTAWRMRQRWGATDNGLCIWEHERGGTSVTYDGIVSTNNNNGVCTINWGNANGCTMKILGTLNLPSATPSAVFTLSVGKSITYRALTNGQLMIGNTGTNQTSATLTAGIGASITNGAGSITVAAQGMGLTTVLTDDEAIAMVTNRKYITFKSSLQTLTLPASSVFGDCISIQGLGLSGTGGWKIAQGPSQQIYSGSLQTTVSTAGSITSGSPHDSITLVCAIANLRWVVISQTGTLTFV